VTETSAMASWLCEFDRQHPVDLLVANAGISGGPDPDNPSEGAEALARQVRVNLLGAINTVEPLLPALCSRRRGRIAVIASIAAYRGLPYSPGYCASKAGLRAYAEALRPRLEQRNIGMTVVSGFSVTMTDALTDLPHSCSAATPPPDRQAHRPWPAPGRFSLPLVLGCNSVISPAVIGDAILRRYRFRIHSA
jgi:NADP-dependent 3-hydroxy acid dehydrogenase YdfG